MLSHLIHLLTAETGLVAEHAAAYAELAAVESAQAATAFRRRVLLQAVSLLLFMLALACGLMALLLLAVIPLTAMPAPWALIVVPLLPCVAAVCVRLGLQRQRAIAPFAVLRRQIELDVGMLRQPEQSR